MITFGVILAEVANSLSAFLGEQASEDFLFLI